MKSFSAAAYSGATSEGLGNHSAPIIDPLALFTDFQWFLYRARNTVYFTSFSETVFNKDQLMTLVAKMVTLAPQLTHGFRGALPGMPLPPHLLEAITSIEMVEDFDKYPDVWLTPGLELFDQTDMPLFRVKAAVRRNGPDATGRASMILIQSAHAMMEGADSALLTRSLSSARAPGGTSITIQPWWHRLVYGVIAALMSPVHLFMAHVLSPKPVRMHFASLSFPRAVIRRAADNLGVSQRALMFGLVMFALNKGGSIFSTRCIRTVYTTLDDDRTRKGDDYFRLRAIEANFDVKADFESFVRAVDAEIARVEAKDTAPMQLLLNSMFKTHRFLARLLPFLYTPRFFRFNNDYHMVLTLVPPHRIAGNLTLGMTEPVYCGSYHPGSNLCTFVPGREFVTFNFSMRQEHLPQVEVVRDLLEAIEAA